MIQVIPNEEPAKMAPPRSIGVNPEELLVLPTSARYGFCAEICRVEDKYV